MKYLLELEELGYAFSLDGDIVRYTYEGEDLDRKRVRPRLQALRQNKCEVVLYLRQRASIEARADDLLARADGTPGWARQWADLAIEAGWPCWGMTWAEWADDLAQDVGVEQTGSPREGR